MGKSIHAYGLFPLAAFHPEGKNAEKKNAISRMNGGKREELGGRDDAHRGGKNPKERLCRSEETMGRGGGIVIQPCGGYRGGKGTKPCNHTKGSRGAEANSRKRETRGFHKKNLHHEKRLSHNKI